MKKGDKVKCVEGSEYLTKGKVYTVVELVELGRFLKIEDDEGDTMPFMIHRFIPYPDKVAVHCPTAEMYERVNLKVGCFATRETIERRLKDTQYKKGVCINIKEAYWDSEEFYRKQGYTIITAEEYLKEGDVKKVEVGDTVEITGVQDKRSSIGEHGIVDCVGNTPFDIRVKFPNGVTWGYHKENYKIINKQTNNIKGDNKMNKNIVKVYEKTADAVLVQKWFMEKDSQFDETFYDYLFLLDHKDEFLKEAKRLEKEANKD